MGSTDGAGEWTVTHGRVAVILLLLVQLLVGWVYVTALEVRDRSADVCVRTGRQADACPTDFVRGDGRP